MMSATRTSLVAVLLVAITSACEASGDYRAYGKPVDPSQVAGSWTSTCGAALDLRPDGTGTVTAFPTLGDRSKPFTGPARWNISLGDGWKSSSNPPVLQIHEGPGEMDVDPMDFASVDGKLGFALPPADADTGDYCKFSRSS